MKHGMHKMGGKMMSDKDMKKMMGGRGKGGAKGGRKK